MKVLCEYKTHHYIVEYELSDIRYCPACGSKDTIFVYTDSNDYYVGPEHVCSNCGGVFTIQGPNKTDEGKIIARQIKNGQPDTPNNP